MKDEELARRRARRGRGQLGRSGEPDLPLSPVEQGTPQKGFRQEMTGSDLLLALSLQDRSGDG